MNSRDRCFTIAFLWLALIGAGCADKSAQIGRAVERQNVERVRSLLGAGASPNSIYDGFHILPLAAMGGSTQIVTLLLKSGANVDGRTEWGDTALMLTSDEDIIRLLLQYGADVNAKNHDGKTPLMFVARTSIGKMLIEAGADIDAVDVNGSSVEEYLRRQPLARELLDIIIERRVVGQ